uniref:Integrase catalytic domain-containing protein n=1 Tax=Elaeophora elaphi TaxID=1147741 RepID=A0A0R3RFZ5_9BILA
MQTFAENVKHIGIHLTHLNEIPNISVDEQPNNRNTLTQFFAVKSRAQQHVIGKNEKKSEEDLALELALKKSLKESKRCYRYRKETIHPDYRNYFEDEDVKAEFLRILQQYRYPTAEVVFLQRETANFSLEWMVVVSSLKVALNRLCDTIYGASLFP